MQRSERGKLQTAMKIGIIGSGISGLVAAYRLFPHHDITLFEANDYAGGHTRTVDVEFHGQRYAIDTGFIVFNNWTYPHFVRLLGELDVASRPTTMSFSVRDERTGLEYNGGSVNGLFAQRRNLLRASFWRMLADILRFNREANALEFSASETVAQFLTRRKFGRGFVDSYLLPMGSAIWSCPPCIFKEFPIWFIADFYRQHGLLNIFRRPQWRVIQGGSRSYVRAITNRLRHNIRLNAAVAHVQRLHEKVAISVVNEGTEWFDHVIFACHSDQALKILGSEATVAEREVLTAFPYNRNTAVLHTDESLLPQSRRAWASWNYRVYSNGEMSEQTRANVTYNMNTLQGLKATPTFCVTLNDEAQISPALVLDRFEFHHPVFTTQRAAAQARHGELINANRTSFCGAYWKNGFHEDGVVSAMRVVETLLQPTQMDRVATDERAT